MKTTFSLLAVLSLSLGACANDADDLSTDIAALAPPGPPPLVFRVELPAVEAQHRLGPGGTTLSYVSFGVRSTDVTPRLPADDPALGLSDAARNRSTITFPDAGGCDAHLVLEPNAGGLSVTLFGTDAFGHGACGDLTKNVAERGFKVTLDGVRWANGAWSPLVMLEIARTALHYDVRLPGNVGVRQLTAHSGAKQTMFGAVIARNDVRPAIPTGTSPDLAKASAFRGTIESPSTGSCDAEVSFELEPRGLAVKVSGYDGATANACERFVRRARAEGFTAKVRDVEWVDGTRRPEIVFDVRPE